MFSTTLIDAQGGLQSCGTGCNSKHIWLERIAAIICVPFAFLLNSHNRDKKEKQRKRNKIQRELRLELWANLYILNRFNIFYNFNQINRFKLVIIGIGTGLIASYQLVSSLFTFFSFIKKKKKGNTIAIRCMLRLSCLEDLLKC